MIYVVINKTTGAEVYRYESDAPVEWSGMEFFDFDHLPAPIYEPTPADPPAIAIRGPRIISKLAYLRRFTSEERTAVRAASKVSPVLEDYLELMALAEEINLDDADIISAVNMLSAAGLITPTRANEVLNGY